MATSTARIEANRRNARKSTGPRTAEGKAASRCNAFRHGLAGAGDVLGPGEDAALVAARAASFVRELGAPGEVGALLARRGALLSVRMERAAARNGADEARAAAAAMAAFDAERAAEVDGHLARLGDADPRPALVALEALPLGVPRLAEAWLGLLERFGGEDAADRAGAVATARRWLGVPGEGSGDGLDLDRAGLASLGRRVAAEVGRLGELSRSQVGLVAALDDERAELGLLAGFDPGRAATLGRRYEAAAERGMYRAIRAIAELNRRRDPADRAGFPQPPRPGATPATPDAAPATGPDEPADREAAEPLASFRAGEYSPAIRPVPPAGDAAAAGPIAVEPRRPRPDYRAIDRQLAKIRR